MPQGHGGARAALLGKSTIAPAVRAGKRVAGRGARQLDARARQAPRIFAASNADIVGLNVPTGVPLVYELDAQLKPLRSSYLGDAKAVAEAAAAVARQGRA